MVAQLWGCDKAHVACCVFPFSHFFSSISSPGMMDLLNEVSIAFRESDRSSASASPRGAIYVTNFHHSGGNISFQGSSSDHKGGAVLESSSGVAGDASGCLW